MCNKSEIINLKWTTRNKKYYEELGYVYTKIGDDLFVNVEDIPKNSNTKITATCDGCGEQVKTPYRNYNKIIEANKKYLCKSCAVSEGVKLRDKKSHDRLYNLFIKKCQEHNCTPITTREEFNGIKSYVKYICPKHGETQTFMNNLVSSNAWCYKCGKEKMADKKKLSQDDVIKRVENKNGNILLNPEDYVSINMRNLIVLCGCCKKPFITSLSAINSGEGRCGECGLKQSQKHWKDEAYIYYNRFKDMCDESGYIILSPIEEYENCFSKLRFMCPEHGEQAVSYAKFSAGQRCPQCGFGRIGKQTMLSQEEVTNRINSVNGNILLNPEDYSGNGDINLKIRCSCGEIFITSLVNYERESVNRCQRCTKKISKGELIIKDVLDRYKIEYTSQMKFKDCKDKRVLPFDFYLHEFNTIIEFDGQYHFEPIFGIEQLEYTQRHDKIKNTYCKKNNIKMIRIPYWEGSNIEDIIVKELEINKIKYITYPIKKNK